VATGISGSAIVTGVAIVLVPATIWAPSVGQSDADEKAAIQQASQERAAQNGGVDPQQPQLGQARGAGEEKSQSDDAQDKARTNGGLVKPIEGRVLFRRISVILSVQQPGQRDSNYSMNRREYVRGVASLLQLISQQPITFKDTRMAAEPKNPISRLCAKNLVTPIYTSRLKNR